MNMRFRFEAFLAGLMLGIVLGAMLASL